MFMHLQPDRLDVSDTTFTATEGSDENETDTPETPSTLHEKVCININPGLNFLFDLLSFNL